MKNPNRKLFHFDVKVQPMTDPEKIPIHPPPLPLKLKIVHIFIKAISLLHACKNFIVNQNSSPLLNIHWNPGSTTELSVGNLTRVKKIELSADHVIEFLWKMTQTIYGEKQENSSIQRRNNKHVGCTVNESSAWNSSNAVCQFFYVSWCWYFNRDTRFKSTGFSKLCK